MKPQQKCTPRKSSCYRVKRGVRPPVLVRPQRLSKGGHSLRLPAKAKTDSGGNAKMIPERWRSFSPSPGIRNQVSHSALKAEFNHGGFKVQVQHL